MWLQINMNGRAKPSKIKENKWKMEQKGIPWVLQDQEDLEYQEVPEKKNTNNNMKLVFLNTEVQDFQLAPTTVVLWGAETVSALLARMIIPVIGGKINLAHSQQDAHRA